MKEYTKTKEERLNYFRDLYENAKEKYSGVTDDLARHMEQYRGSSAIDGSDVRAESVRNITYEIVESQISSDIPLPRVECSCYSEKHNRNAKSIERLCTSVRDLLPFEEMNDLDERYTYIYGGSVWLVEWDCDLLRGRERGGVRVHCVSPRDFIPQPSVSSVTDMEYCFLRFTTTKGELVRKYGILQSEVDKSDLESRGTDDDPDPDGECVTVVLCFYKDEDGEVGEFIFSGDLVVRDLPKYYRRKYRVCKNCGKAEEICTCGSGEFEYRDAQYEEPTRIIPLSDGSFISPIAESAPGGSTLENRTRLPYYTPKTFPIAIRRNTSSEGRLLGQSDCEYIRPEQQAINKLETRILQKLLRAGITPIVPEDASITLNNSVFGQLIKMKPGESAAQYGKVDTTPDISQDIAEAERLYDQAKRIIGISDAFQGNDGGYSESGVARQLRISQASGRLESKKKMKYTAYSAIDRLIFEHFLAFADEPRALSYKDAYGRTHSAEFNRYDFLEYDPITGEYVYDDSYLFSVDLNGGAEYQREALWERNLENLRAGTLGDQKSPVTLLRYWQCQERAHYPYARENVEYFKDEVEKAGETQEEEWTQKSL